ncbi:hypothetical protein [uncultured Devosia sp.]|uniref:hypothetical protein n=1 Tax=uncultured Devosia sp. TaxID=211434 RepID=UPI002619CF21|nr:hypothetical protein [uncultured Devosia sp.]
MAINRNYGLLKKQIADECSDDQALLQPLSDASGLSSPIDNAVQSAIALWEREPFYFNGFRIEPDAGSPFQLVAGQEFYGAADYPPLGTLACIKTIRILQGGQNRFTLKERTNDYLDNIAVNDAWRGLPTDYSYFALQLRIYPIPDVAYPVGIVGTQRFADLVEDSDSNAWTADGFDLIKSQAKLILAREVIHDAGLETAMEKAIYGDPMIPRARGYLRALKDETTRRNSSRSRIRPTYF